MFEQLTQLVQQYGGDAVVKNNAIPNKHNEAVINETSNSIFAGLQKIATSDGLSRSDGLTGLFYNSGRPTRFSGVEVRDGISIKVVIEPAGEGIITAFPIY